MHESVKGILFEHGSGVLDFFGLQDLCKQWVHSDGFVSYVDASDTWFPSFGITPVLGEPVGCSSIKKSVLTAFLDNFERPFFMGVSSDVQKYLSDIGYTTLPFAAEAVVDFSSGDLSFLDSSYLRRCRSKGLRAGIEFDCVYNISETIRRDLLDLRDRWRSNRFSFSYASQFFTPSFFLDLDLGQRLFVLKKDGFIVAYCLCYPRYQHGECIGYTVSELIYDPSLDLGLSYVLIFSVIYWVSENTSALSLSLGLVPFSGSIQKESNLVRHGLYCGISKVGKWFYNSDGVDFFSSRFSACMKPVYWSFQGVFPVHEILLIYDLMFKKNQEQTASKMSFTREN